MQRQIIEPADEQAWLALRDQDITSTMSSALFGLSPYQTEFEVWHSKASGISLPFDENDRVRAGKRMQDFAADTVAEANGWRVWRADEYVRIPELRIGSSFDYRVETPKGIGLLEIKAVDYWRFRDTWLEDEAPAHIEIQAQHQLEVYDKFDWCIVVAFTGLYDWHSVLYERDRVFGARLVRRIGEFWASVDAGQAPKPDYSRDGDVIKALHKGGPPLDAVDDVRLNGLFARYHRTQAEKKAAEEDFKAAQAELLEAVGDHSEAFGKDFKLKVSMVKPSPGTLVTDEMVGEYIGGRAGYPKMILSDLHKQKGRAA